MAIKRRRRANQVSPPTIPKLPSTRPKDWPVSLYAYLQNLDRSLQGNPTIILGIQDAGTDMPLRAILNFVGATVADDEDNDRTTVTV